jgi:hypothetical protein
MTTAPIEELYAAPLAEFVATRERLAGELAREGRKDEAQALKKLRRPSMTAWATNQVVREARAALDEMLAASERLRRGQDALLAGRSDQVAYQAGVEDLRRATAALAAASREVLGRAGRGDDRTLVDAVIANARAAALDAELRRVLLEGRLTADLEAGDSALAGFLAAGRGAASGAHLSLVPPAPPPDADAARREKAAREEHARRLEAARAEAATAREVAARAETAARTAREARDRAEARAREAERVLAAERESLRAAQAALDAAEKHVAAVTAESHAAARRLDALGERR